MTITNTKHKPKRSLIVSDIHSNADAFQSVLDDCFLLSKNRKNHHYSGAPFHEIWCVGDIVGYGPEPEKVVDMLRGFHNAGVSVYAVKGNHDTAVAGLDDPDKTMHDDASECAKHNARNISSGNKTWLKNLPDLIQVGPKIENPAGITGERRMITLAHATPYDPQGAYVTTYRRALKSLDHLDEEWVPHTPHAIVGHTHEPRVFQFDPQNIVKTPSTDGSLPFYGPAHNDFILEHNRRIKILENQGNGRFVLNPGSVGQPRDGDPRASYAIAERFGPTNQSLKIISRRVGYDVQKVQEKMRAASLPRNMYFRLQFGH